MSIQREALEAIIAMDPDGLRADDLGRAVRIARAALSAPTERVVPAVTKEELLDIARRVEALKRECGMCPESPIAIQNSRYMVISHAIRELAARSAAPSPAEPAQEPAGVDVNVPVALDHIACIDGGELRFMSGRCAPRHDCELYAMPGGGRAPKLYARATITAPVAPIDMVLHCPKCGMQHIDAPDERTPGWVNEPHRSHLCHGCGHIWRPADVPTNGVAAVKTKGKADSPVAASTAPVAPRALPETMSRDEMLQYYSACANLSAHEALQYQKRIQELEAKLRTAPPPAETPTAPGAPKPAHLRVGDEAWLRVRVDTPVAEDGWCFCTPPSHPRDVARGLASPFYDARQTFGPVVAAPPPAETPTAPVAPKTLEALTEHHKLDTDRHVFFYEQDFYVLSNFSSFNLEWRGLVFPTSEHAYHWAKFASEGLGWGGRSDIAHLILTAPSAHEAFKTAERMKAHRRTDWDDVKVELMLDILRAKADQHEYVRRKLLATGDRELIEDSWRDGFWGWGHDRTGQNMLGKLWMQVRQELRALATKNGMTLGGSV